MAGKGRQAGHSLGFGGVPSGWESALVVAGMYAFCFLLYLLWIVFSPEGFLDSSIEGGVAAGGLMLWASIIFGLKARAVWGWWLAAIAFGIFTLMNIVSAALIWINVATEGLVDRHGVGVPGVLILGLLGLGCALMTGFPFLALMRHRVERKR